MVPGGNRLLRRRGKKGLLRFDRGGFELYTHHKHAHQLSGEREELSGDFAYCIRKTESFLLLIFLHLFSELRRGDQAIKYLLDITSQTGGEGHEDSGDNEVASWWSSRNARRGEEIYVPHGGESSRQGGLRALIIYPLNALVDDQMRRLRFSLDSREMHDFYDAELGGQKPRIGRYNSETIGGTASRINRHGNPDNQKAKQYAEEIRARIELPYVDMYRAITGEQQVDPGSLMPSLIDGTPNSDGFVVQNPWGCEQRCRWDIHETVPDILVTNFSMLQVMAARAIDDPIFEQTSDYLESEGSLFHLVLDDSPAETRRKGLHQTILGGRALLQRHNDSQISPPAPL